MQPPQLGKAIESYSRTDQNPIDSQKVETTLEIVSRCYRGIQLVIAEVPCCKLFLKINTLFVATVESLTVATTVRTN